MNMNVKKYRAGLLLSAVLVTIICIIAVVYTRYTQKKYDNPTIHTPQYQYVLKEYDEQIGVFKANEDMPFRMLNVYTFNLPIVDQYELKEGVLVQDDEKLRIIIEDYES